MAWPGCDYRAINPDGLRVGSYFRGSGWLKIRMPRQLHKYIHTITEPPLVSEYEIMEQWAKESQQIERLYNTVRFRNLSDIDMPEEQREKYRFSNYLQKLEAMEDGQLGYMPSREYLMGLEIDDARRTLRALARVRGFSNARKQQRQFFDSAIPSFAA